MAYPSLSKPRPMTEHELLSIIHTEIFEAVGYLGGNLSEQRRLAMRYYLGEPFGDEIEGQSQVIMTEVRDAIEWLLPELVKVFMSGDKVVEFEPHDQDDEEAAEQETDYINHVVYKQNKGFQALYDAFKDALLSKTGILKCWVEDEETEDQETYEGLTDYQVVDLEEDDDVEPIAFTEDPINGHLMTVRKSTERKAIKVAAVPPEEFLISRRAKSIEDARFVGHRVRKTASELISMGFSPAQVEKLPSHDDQEFNEERLERFNNDEEWPEGGNTAQDGASREIWVTDGYIRVDYDGDNYAELRKILVGGNDGAYVMLENERADTNRPRFFDITPVRITHKFFGMSIADLVMDLQKIHSVLFRQMLNSTYLTNNPRHAYDTTMDVELDALMIARAGGTVGVGGPPAQAIMPLVTEQLGQSSFQMIDRVDTILEKRTGITRHSTGLNPDSLNETFGGVQLLQEAAQQRKQMIARLFAETGVKDFYLGVHELARKHQDVAAVVRLRGHWVDVDPRQWRERRDMTVHVGIGTGNKEAQLIHLSKIEEAQAAAVQVQQGIDGPLVGRKEIFNLQKEKALLAGFPVPELFWIDPNDPDAQQQEQPQEQEGPSPELMLIQGQLELAKEQLNLQRQKHQDEMRMKMFDISTSRDVDMKELEQKYTKMLHEYDLGREQADNARQAGEQRAAADAAKVAAMKSNGSGPP